MNNTSDDKKKVPTGPFPMGEHMFMTVMLGAVAERHPEGSPMRAKLEAYVKENVPPLIREGNETGDWLAAFNRFMAYLEVVLSQKEADRDFMERSSGIEANKKAVSEALAAGNVREALETRVFHLFKTEEFRDLRHPDFQRLIQLALLAGDEGVFKRVGRALLKKPEISGPEDVPIDKFQFVLIKYWVRGPQGQIGLCRLTDEALTDFCNLSLGRIDLTLDKVRKTRQRLGLKKGAEPWFTKVEKRNGVITISLDE